jgi:hypothetical protein
MGPDGHQDGVQMGSRGGQPKQDVEMALSSEVTEGCKRWDSRISLVTGRLERVTITGSTVTVDGEYTNIQGETRTVTIDGVCAG